MTWSETCHPGLTMFATATAGRNSAPLVSIEGSEVLRLPAPAGPALRQACRVGKLTESAAGWAAPEADDADGDQEKPDSHSHDAEHHTYHHRQAHRVIVAEPALRRRQTSPP